MTGSLLPKRGALRTATAATGLLAIVIAASPASASADPHWAGHVVRYIDRSHSRWDVRTAVALWNRSQTGVRLVAARRGQRAQIRIFASACPQQFAGHPPGGPCGFYPPDGRVYLATRRDGGGLFTSGEELAAHELGHALGLLHSGPCSVMVPNVAFKQCTSPEAQCGPTDADARSIVRLYGGHVRRFDRSRGCLAFLPLPPKPAGTLVSPPGPATATPPPPHAVIPSAVELGVRNDSAWAWGRAYWGPQGIDDVILLTVDASGRRVKVSNDCSFGGSIGDVQRARSPAPVRPGATATFLLRLCPPSQDRTIHLRPYTVGRGATIPGTQVLTVQIRGTGSEDTESPGSSAPNQPPVASFSFQPRGGEPTNTTEAATVACFRLGESRSSKRDCDTNSLARNHKERARPPG